MSRSYFVHLLSNTVTNPPNKTNKFRVRLPQTLQFDGEWVCGVHSIMYPHSWTSDYGNDVMKLHLLDNTVIEINPSVPTQKHITNFTLELNNTLHELLVNHFRLGRKKREAMVQESEELKKFVETGHIFKLSPKQIAVVSANPPYKLYLLITINESVDLGMVENKSEKVKIGENMFKKMAEFDLTKQNSIDKQEALKKMEDLHDNHKKIVEKSFLVEFYNREYVIAFPQDDVSNFVIVRYMQNNFPATMWITKISLDELKNMNREFSRTYWQSLKDDKEKKRVGEKRPAATRFDEEPIAKKSREEYVDIDDEDLPRRGPSSPKPPLPEPAPLSTEETLDWLKKQGYKISIETPSDKKDDKVPDEFAYKTELSVKPIPERDEQGNVKGNVVQEISAVGREYKVEEHESDPSAPLPDFIRMPRDELLHYIRNNVPVYNSMSENEFKIKFQNKTREQIVDLLQDQVYSSESVADEASQKKIVEIVQGLGYNVPNLKRDEEVFYDKTISKLLLTDEDKKNIAENTKFVYDRKQNRYFIELPENFVDYVTMTEHLAYILGYEKDIKIFDKQAAKYIPDLNADIHQLFVYENSGLTENIIVGDKMTSLLRIVNVRSNFGEVHEEIYNTPIFKRVIAKEISEIEIEVKTSRNTYVPFNYGNIILILLFKKLYAF